MQRSSTKILTSHAGSLPRPDALIEANRARAAGEASEESAFQTRLEAAVISVEPAWKMKTADELPFASRMTSP